MSNRIPAKYAGAKVFSKNLETSILEGLRALFINSEYLEAKITVGGRR